MPKEFPYDYMQSVFYNTPIKSLRDRLMAQFPSPGAGIYDVQGVDEEVTGFVDVAVGGVGEAVTTQVALAYTYGDDSFLARH